MYWTSNTFINAPYWTSVRHRLIRRLARAAEAAEAKIRDAPRMAEPSPPRRGQSQGASSVASYVGDDRDAWSCPLPNEIFEVGSQGQDEDIAALGVAIALRNHHAWCTPVRHASQTLDSSFTFPAALIFCAARLAGMAPCPLQREGRAAHRARGTSSFVPIRRSAPCPSATSAEGAASIR